MFEINDILHNLITDIAIKKVIMHFFAMSENTNSWYKSIEIWVYVSYGGWIQPRKTCFLTETLKNLNLIEKIT